MKPVIISQKKARKIWLKSSLLADVSENKLSLIDTVSQLGYVQIDSIFVIERCHHHILYSRIPNYKKDHLKKAQSIDKSVFEYWTHALAYIATKDLPYFIGSMNDFYKKKPSPWYQDVTKPKLNQLLGRIQKEGAITLREIDDEVDHIKNDWWTSRKPSKKILQFGFNAGKLVISERIGIIKKFELFERHFKSLRKIHPASEVDRMNYKIDRALKAQGLVSLESICYLTPSLKKDILDLISQRVRAKNLIPVTIRDFETSLHWVSPLDLEKNFEINHDRTHLLSPFDPLIIQRKRLNGFFNYNHIFEAYVPQAKRKFGYFALPILRGDEIIGLIDLKTDRQLQKIKVNKWSWLIKKNSSDLKLIEHALHHFEKFQLQ